jgi:OOP family OmpA-OmpF porin
LTLVALASLWLILLPPFGSAQNPPIPIAVLPIPPQLTIVRDPSQLTISGHASSAAHEEKMRELATALAPDAVAGTDLVVSNDTPPGWSLVTEMTLRAIAATYSATAVVDEKQVAISGFTTDRDAWNSTIARLQDSLLPGMEFQQRVTDLDPGMPFEEQCLNLMRAAVTRRRVEFSQSGNHLNSNAFGLLDELVELATDCPAVLISVTGHTDRSGDEAFNQALSKARADAVVDYMLGKGIAAERLQSAGAGFTAPLYAETNARSRLRNRRIEFAFSLPEASGPEDR